jgi:hypothetical protein
MRLLPFYLILMLLTAIPLNAAEYLWPLPFNDDNLSSIFGDWRSRRYHAGIDIRTGGVDGKIVVAPDDCTLWRVRTSWYGYGKALYLRLSDGRIAVFGHLSRLHPEIEKYVAKQQLGSESYNQDLYPEPERFQFARGDTVAWSGSTGVGAPHLHFEIRTADNRPLNPLQLPGLEVRDTRAPQFKRLHLITGLDPELVEALGLPTEYQFRRNAQTGVYEIDAKIPVGILPFWLSAEVFDFVGRNDWRKPVFEIELRHAGRLLYRQTQDTVDFATNYLIDATRNYQRAMQGEKFFQNLVTEQMLTQARGIGGVIDDFSQPLEIIARDVAGNSCRAQVHLDPVPTRHHLVAAFVHLDTLSMQQLLVERGSSNNSIYGAFFPWADSLLFVFFDSLGRDAYREISDLRGSIIKPFAIRGRCHVAFVGKISDVNSPKEVRQVTVRLTEAGNRQTTATFSTNFQPPTAVSGGEVSWLSPDGKFQIIAPPVPQTFFPLDQNSYFRIEMREVGDQTDYAINPEAFAAREKFTYSYGLDNELPPGAGLYQVFGKSTLSFLGAKVDSLNHTISAASYRLGVFTMRIDTIAPTIKSVFPRNGARITAPRPEIKAKLEDTLSGIDKITLRLDGKWLISEYDPESGWVRATPHFNLLLGKHRLDIIVRDKLGNERHLKSGFSMVDQAKKNK